MRFGRALVDVIALVLATETDLLLTPVNATTDLGREKGKVVDLQLDWLDEPSIRITPGTSGTKDLNVVVDLRLSLNQVAQACRQLGDLGWEILGRWCLTMRPTLGPAQSADRVPAAFGIATPDRVIRWFSPQVEVLLGWPSEALVGTSALALAHPGQAREAATLTNTVDQDGVAQGTMLVRTVDGGYRVLHSTVKSVRYPSGEPAFMLGELRLAEDSAGQPSAASQVRHLLGDNAA